VVNITYFFLPHIIYCTIKVYKYLVCLISQIYRVMLKILKGEPAAVFCVGTNHALIRCKLYKTKTKHTKIFPLKEELN
jgi:hypothetical protein